MWSAQTQSWDILGYEAINLCAAETGEIIDPGLCKRMAGSDLKAVLYQK